MKTTKSITINIETWSKARARYSNLSEKIEQLLEADLSTNKKPRDKKELKEEMKRQEAIISALKNELEKQEEQKSKHTFEYEEV